KSLPQCYLGVGFQDIDDDRAATLNLPGNHGIEITVVAENSPAMKAGILIGDIVLEYNGKPVVDMDAFSKYVFETPVNREISLTIQRNGERLTLPLVTGSRVLVARNTLAAIQPRPVVPNRAQGITHDTPRATMSW